MEGHGHSDPNFLLFVVPWIFIVISGAVFFLGSRNARLKRKLFPLYIVAGSIIFLGFIYFADGTVPLLALIIVPLIGLMNIGMIRFCNACGATVNSHIPFSVPRYCPKCGATLDGGTEASGG